MESKKQFVPMVFLNEDKAVTTSRAVAEQFEKTHNNVLRDIDNLVSLLKIEPSTVEFLNKNFELTTKKDSRGKEQRIYFLTRDGFTLLAMGFTGAKAIQFKVAYINAFNRMESIIRYGASPERVHQLAHTTKELEAVNPTPNSFLLEAGIEPEETKPSAHQTAEEIATVFITAIMEALKSNRYYLSPKNARIDKGEKRELLGIYDSEKMSLISSVAYKIYAEYVGIKYDVHSIGAKLSSPLFYSGLIYKKTKADSRAKIKNRECAVTRVKLKRAEELYSKTKALVSAQSLGQADTKAHIKPTE